MCNAPCRPGTLFWGRKVSWQQLEHSTTYPCGVWCARGFTLIFSVFHFLCTCRNTVNVQTQHKLLTHYICKGYALPSEVLYGLGLAAAVEMYGVSHHLHTTLPTKPPHEPPLSFSTITNGKHVYISGTFIQDTSV